MKPLLIPVLLVLGIATGGTTSYIVTLVMPRPSEANTASASEQAPPKFVSTGKILAPLVFASGRLAGYVSFNVQLEVAPGKAEFVTARLPRVLHAINLRTYRTPMTSGPDGMLPDIDIFRRLVMVAAAEAVGTGIITRVAITQAVPS